MNSSITEDQKHFFEHQRSIQSLPSKIQSLFGYDNPKNKKYNKNMSILNSEHKHNNNDSTNTNKSNKKYTNRLMYKYNDSHLINSV